MNRTDNLSIALQRSVLFVAFLIAVCSCGKTREYEDVKEMAEEHRNARFANSKNKTEAQFLVNATELNIEAIYLSQLAQNNGSTTDVKELGRLIEKEHIKILKELTLIADSKQISIPNSPTESALDDYKLLCKKTLNEYDKLYCELMVNCHKKAVQIFETESKKTVDAEIRNWVGSTLPILREHLDYALICQIKCENVN